MSDQNEKLLDLFKTHENFCKALLDAYVVIDMQGKVVKSNQMFSLISGKKSKQIIKADSLNDLITFEMNGKSFEVSHILNQKMPTRLDEVRGDTPTQPNMNLILGVYPFLDGEAHVGTFLLVRDVTAETNLQDKYKVKSTQSVTDKLTGLYNRGYFDQYLKEIIEHVEGAPQNDRLEPFGRNLSLVMCDIDHFKKKNDNYGHQAGDFILAGVAEIFRNNLRKTDTVCRYGGEEFVIILPQTDASDAAIAANKIRELVEKKIFDYQGQIIPTTISMGVSQLKVGKEKGAELMQRADEALYFAKENGRNRVCVYGFDGKIR